MLSFAIRQTGQLPDPKALTEATRVAVTASVELMFRRAVINLSGRVARLRSGRTLKGLRAAVSVVGNQVVGAVQNTHFVGRILEKGAVGKEMIARKRTRGRGRGRRGARGFFAFQVGGRWVYATRVNIPPRRPRPWATLALHESEADIQRLFELEVGRVLAAPTRTDPKILTSSAGPAGRG